MYSVPSFVSQPVRELIAGMLVVDPTKRITIPEIRANKWFNIDLPDYLKLRNAPQTLLVNQRQGDAESLYVDDDIIAYLQKKMGFSRETIKHALKEQGNNQIKVAYELVIDHRQMVADGKMSTNAAIRGFLAASPPAWEDTSFLNQDVNSGDASKSTSRQQKNAYRKSNLSHSHDASSPETSLATNQTSTVQVIDATLPSAKPQETQDKRGDSSLLKSSRQVRSRWHYGIRSKSNPLDIMVEIYRAVQNAGMKWKTMDPFRLRCVHVTARNQRVKVDIQLFQMGNGSYLVDFKNVVHESDDAFNDGATQCRTVNAFFDVCSKLITELAISG